MVLSILLVTKKVKLLNRYVLSYLKWKDTKNALKTEEKNILFVIKNDDLLNKYNEIWNKIKKTLNIKFHSLPVYDEKHMKAKVREFNGVIKTKILGDEIPKENGHYACLACVTIDSVMRMKKKRIIHKFI